ncbi:MAG: VCBS repeat-containing protein, partial [Gemmatimonadetes bacterium]|nr:VCBS repeat-containing protein [Gemmatimonadota bacterium]
TFREVLDQQMPAISYFSMGSDIADVDNDGWPDVYTTDMMPEDDYRLKMMSSFEGWDLYQTKLRNGYHHQFMRNMLQMNNGNGTFSDIGQMAGVARTDWSWSALIADFDQDGFKDLHVTNGMPRDLTSQDFISFLANDQTMAAAVKSKRVDFLRLVRAMSTTPLPNYAFRNDGRLTFSNVSAEWGLNTAGFSSGAAYADLNGDGALDLVVNNINQEVSIYRNNARALLDNRYLQIRLEGEGGNRFAIGARVTVQSGEQIFVQELMPSRGFQSSVDYPLTFGVGKLDTLSSVTVEWPDGRVSVRDRVAANQRLTFRQSEARPAGAAAPALASTPLFADESAAVALDFVHRENEFVDFDREPLIPKLLSTEGPYAAVADVNGDRLDDVFIGGAKDQAGRLLLQRRDGSFAASNLGIFEQDRASEDLGAVFFEANGDDHPDLYVVSGGNDFSEDSPALQDRLYLNDGRGGFRKAEGHLPADRVSGSRVAAADFDGDGDVDLFVGGRVVPWRYGADPTSTLLRNDGRGRFSDVTDEVAPGLRRAGMVTDALWRDLTGDGRPELVVVGEWMPISVFRNTGRGRLQQLDVPGLRRSNGWWNRIVPGDFTGDGRVDFVVGNLGLNTRLSATAEVPSTMHVKDFDRNGFTEPIIAYPTHGVSYPLELRDEIIKSLPFLKPRFPSYRDYAAKTIDEVFRGAELADAALKKAYTFHTALARNNGDGSFTLLPLPREAQLSPVYGMLPGDFDSDGSLDLLVAGNFDGLEPKIGRMHASYGLFLR